MKEQVERELRMALGISYETPMPAEAIALHDQYIRVASRCGVQGPDLRAIIMIAITVERQQSGKKK